MAFRRPKKQPEFADLKGILAQTKKQTESPLYQTVQTLIERLTQFRAVTIEEVADINNSINTTDTIINITANKKATYLTETDESLNLPKSRQILAGTGITLDYSVPNKLTISSTGGGSADTYDSPLTDGDVDEMELITADGDCIIVQVPIP